jgi:citronellol/citronellal dehydrogenase
MRSLKGKTLFITGASRGIGRAIALRAAADGANIAIASKTDEPNPKLPGTIHTVADEIVAAGGRALPIAMDVRREEEIEAAVAKTANTFGGIDILVNNASALFLAKTPDTPMKRFDLMFSVNARGTFATTQSAPASPLLCRPGTASIARRLATLRALRQNGSRSRGPG